MKRFASVNTKFNHKNNTVSRSEMREVDSLVNIGVEPLVANPDMSLGKFEKVAKSTTNCLGHSFVRRVHSTFLYTRNGPKEHHTEFCINYKESVVENF